MFNAELLKSAKVQDFIKKSLKLKLNELQVSTLLAKEFNKEERISIMDYMALIPKICEKFGLDLNNKIKNESFKFLLCDKLALEQSTAKDIGKFKANFWKNKGHVHDLCCGMGADSFFLPENLNLTGIDLDKDRLQMYSYNTFTMRNLFNNKENEKFIKTILGDAREIASKNKPEELDYADYFLIDPARRFIVEENQRDLSHLTPTFEEILEISKYYKGGMAKLPPGYPTNEIPPNVELVYLGGNNDCRELLVLFNELAQNPGKVHAILVEKNGNSIAKWSGNLNDIQTESNKNAEKNLPGKIRSFRNATSEKELCVGEITKYLSEPNALLIRSHLFSTIAKEIDENSHLISEGIAYVATDIPLFSPGFSCFEIIDKSEISTSAVKLMLKNHNIGKLTLKSRGVKINPNEEIKRLKPKGKNQAILFYTRAKGKKIALLANRI